MFSEDPEQQFRYLLDHTIDETVPSYARKTVVFIMLNPSIANESQLDPTLRRCRGFTQRLGGHHMTILNLFAFRATLPKDMLAAPDPIGPLNDSIIEKTVAREGVLHVIAGWGCHGTHLGRDRQVMELLAGRLSCLRLTKEGHPSHPLYLPAASPLLSFGFSAPLGLDTTTQSG